MSLIYYNYNKVVSLAEYDFSYTISYRDNKKILGSQKQFLFRDEILLWIQSWDSMFNILLKINIIGFINNNKFSMSLSKYLMLLQTKIILFNN